jgi:hypothetical protein
MFRAAMVCSIFLMFVFVSRTDGQGCANNLSCTTSPYWYGDYGGCTVWIEYETCVGGTAQRYEECVNDPHDCHTECTCGCDETGYNISYENDCGPEIIIHDQSFSCLACPTPTPTPTPEPTPPECPDCEIWDGNKCTPAPPGECGSQQAGCNCSPIVIDVDGDGFDLTSAVGGVNFDLNGDGVVSNRLSWTSANSDDAWLALDRNGNGTIDNGLELFGNYTSQPTPAPGSERQGFAALAEFDKFQKGGDGDGLITKKDSIFDDLRLWKDVNHNGISESTELFTLPQLGLRKLYLDCRESRRVDQHGNRFKYRAKVKDDQDAQLGRWAWDVFLVPYWP